MTSSKEHRIDDEGTGVLVGVGQAHAYLLPTSVRRLPVAVQRQLFALAEIGGQIRHLDDHVDEVVPEIRRGGASWAQIGAALGITGEAARQRYRVLLEDDSDS